MPTLDLEDEIVEILDQGLNDKNLNKLEERILFTKGELEVLLGGSYKNTPYPNKLKLNISENNILLHEIIYDKGADKFLLLLIKIAIENGLSITGKSEPFIHRKILSWEKYDKRRKLLRQYYESFLFKSKGKSEYDRYLMKFDFENLNNEEKKVFRNRLNIWLKKGKYPKIF